MKKIHQWPLDYGTPVKVESSFSLQESVDRLKEITKTKAWGFFHDFGMPTGEDRSKLVGNISIENLDLFRVRQGGYHMGRPHLLGSFKDVDGKIYLEGYFDVSRWFKLAFWIALSILPILAMSLGLAFFEPSNSIGQKITVALFIPAALVIIAVMKKFSQKYITNDIAWISNKIRETL